MRRAKFYSNCKNPDMPLRKAFITYWQKIIVSVLSIALLNACGSLSWHSIEQTPAVPMAYMRDGVYVSGAYVRSASITEIDGKLVAKSNDNLIKVTLGEHRVKINCDEAEGEFDTKEFNGETKILKFEAKIQRTYLVRCVPFTHWWIEDLENNEVVAGEKL